MKGNNGINRSMSVLMSPAESNKEKKDAIKPESLSGAFFSAATNFSSTFGELKFILKAILTGQGVDIAKQSRNLKNQQMVAKTAELLNSAISGKSFDDIDAVELGSIIDRDNKPFTLKLEKDGDKINIVSVDSAGNKEIVNLDQPITAENFKKIQANVATIVTDIKNMKLTFISILNTYNQRICDRINNRMLHAHILSGRTEYKDMLPLLTKLCKQEYKTLFNKYPVLSNSQQFINVIVDSLEGEKNNIGTVMDMKFQINDINLAEDHFGIGFSGSTSVRNEKTGKYSEIPYTRVVDSKFTFKWKIDQEDKLQAPSNSEIEHYDEEYL